MPLSALLATAALALGLMMAHPASAATPQAEANFRAGQQAAMRSDSVTARREFERACEGGHLPGCTMLGTMVADGVGGPADLRRARQLFAKGCVTNISWSSASDAGACLMLGDMYAEGEGGPRQPARAAYLYARACDIGSGEGCDALVELMLDETLIPLDTEDMLGVIAARACFTEGLDYCGELYMFGTLGMMNSYPDALQTFTAAHRLPAGTPPNRKKEMLTQACNGGVARACARAAWEWKHGFHNMPVDQTKALELYLQACTLGDGAGCSELGDAMRTGTGVPKSLPEAADAYHLGCQVAYPPACRSLAQMHQSGEITADLPLARALQAFVCDSGWGCVGYANMLIRGVGGAVDQARARQVLKAECDNPDFSSNACEVLARLG